MTVLIVTESYFGNTLTVTEVIASGLAQIVGQGSVTIVRAGEAPRQIPSDVNLLLVGAPTHDYSLPKEQTRKQANQKGATVGEDIGVREWIEQVTPRDDLPVVTFDTSIKSWFMPGTASKTAAKLLKKRGFGKAKHGQSFWVGGMTGPLVDNEEQRAEAWGVELGKSLAG